MKLSPDQVRRLRLRAQRLHPDAARAISGVAPLVQAVCGIQAQDLAAAPLAIRARSRDLVAEDVQHAREVERSIVLTWAMRGTMHLVAAADVGWMQTLFGPTFIRSGERRYRQLGLDADTRARAARIMRDAIGARGPLTRPELAEILAGNDIPVEGQAIAHLVRYAALDGTLCFGPEQDGTLTYTVLDEWITPEQPPDADPLAGLARRYLEAYGPATPHDFASWSGLPVTQAKSGFDAIAPDLLGVEIDGAPARMLKRHADWLDAPPSDPVVRLLPAFDLYLLGYRSRDFMIADAYARRIHPGGGMIKPSLVVEGRILGGWRLERKKSGTNLVVMPFEPLPDAVLPGLEAEAQDVGRFLGREITLRVQSSG